jgi:pimeloyl-ACP methyl ester carboxylesterase
MEGKSTNVRTRKGFDPVPWIRHGLGATASLSPALAARVAERLFLRPPPVRRSTREEAAVLARAESLRVPHEQGTLAVWRWGVGRPVLLAHGWGGSAGQMSPFVPLLVARGFAPVAFDAPGHGLSPGATSSLPQFASALAAVARHVGAPHAVVAHSLGGAATSLAVADGLAVERAAFVGPPADARQWFQQFVRTLELAPQTAQLTRRRIEARLGVSFERLHAGALGPSLALPLLVVHDRSDREVPFAAGERVVATARNARLVPTDGLGHRRILRDAAVLREVVDFVTAPDRLAQAA